MKHATLKKFTEFSLKKLLRLGIALLGISLSLNQLIMFGYMTFFLIILNIILIFLIIYIIGNFFNLSKNLSYLIGMGTAICGVTAIIATSSIINPKKYESVNTSSAIHNGHRFEPLSTMWYEDRYKTTIGEFGCIRHPTISFLGASPDGINIDPTNDRYGRALEIKNPVNRELTGIPKKDYWIQMQMQMEVWDLEECDFLETCFKCYDNEEEFDKDGVFNETKDGKLKGVIIQFFVDGAPVYKYPPIVDQQYCTFYLHQNYWQR